METIIAAVLQLISDGLSMQSWRVVAYELAAAAVLAAAIALLFIYVL